MGCHPKYEQCALSEFQVYKTIVLMLLPARSLSACFLSIDTTRHDKIKIGPCRESSDNARYLRQSPICVLSCRVVS